MNAMTTVRVLAIDPGSEQSGWLVWARGVEPFIERFGIAPNDKLLESLRRNATGVDVVVIEEIESYGMAVGRDVFRTVHWAGRLAEAAHELQVAQLPRRAVKLAICGNTRAKDANIRAALMDRFGGEAAKGTKAAPGPLHGISKDVWSALAIAITWVETHGWPEVAGGGSEGE
jgi:Holliday junction resolvasome RuvABC endonuclease subunit